MNQFHVATFEGPGARPKIQLVDRPKVPGNAALFEVGACGVCGTDLHILKGHWPTPLPWPFTRGHPQGTIPLDGRAGARAGSAYTENALASGDLARFPVR